MFLDSVKVDISARIILELLDAEKHNLRISYRVIMGIIRT